MRCNVNAKCKTSTKSEYASKAVGQQNFHLLALPWRCSTYILHSIVYSMGRSLVCLLLVLTIATAAKKERVKLPSFVKICRRSDPQLNACARKSLISLQPRFAAGIPELYVPPVEPLQIPEMKLDQDSGAIYLHSTFKDISIRGLSNFTVTELAVDPVKYKFTIGMHYEAMSLEALYEMKGKIMMMPLTGEGDCKADFSDVNLTTIIYGQRQKRGGRSYIKVRDIDIKYKLGNAKINLSNLFNGDNALGERMNSFLNENWETLADEVKPLMESAVTSVIRATTDKLFSVYSLDDLLPE